MGDNSYMTEITRDGKTLILFTARLHDKHSINHVEDVVAEAFKKISPYLKEKRQVLYIRDVPDFCIDGEIPSIACETATEVVLALPSWNPTPRSVELFELSVYQSLFLLARLQNVGHSQTFGDEIFNLGLAAWFAHVMTGYDHPCAKLKVTKHLRRMALRRWDLRSRPYSRWFTGGERSKWKGYAIGYELAEINYGDGTGIPFAIDHAVKAYGSWYPDKLWALNHMRSKRSAFIMAAVDKRPSWSYLFGL